MRIVIAAVLAFTITLLCAVIASTLLAPCIAFIALMFGASVLVKRIAPKGVVRTRTATRTRTPLLITYER